MMRNCFFIAFLTFCFFNESFAKESALGKNRVEEKRDYGKAVYAYSKSGNVLSIEKHQLLSKNVYRLYSSEKFIWKGNLLRCSITENGRGEIVACQTMDYDDNGNLIEERVYGNLSGNNKTSILIDKEGMPIKSSCESYGKSYSYSPENKLIKEEEDNGKTILYEYLPETSLVSSCLICDKNRILIRYFYEYDENGEEKRVVYDDGNRAQKEDFSGVSERHIIETSFHENKIKIIEEKYYDFVLCKEIPLKTTQNIYSPKGLLLQQNVIDANGKKRYSIFKEYDEEGRIIGEIDPVGARSKTSYDKSGRQVFLQLGCSDGWTEYVYDKSGNIIRTDKKGMRGEILSISNRYDKERRKISQIDEQGNETRYVYDPFGNLIEEIFPEVLDENDRVIKPKKIKEYDIHGNAIKETDEKGYVTRKRYNARGQEVKEIYPDGSVYLSEYNLDGTLRKTTAKNGSSTIYAYDALSRVIKAEVYTSKNKLIEQSFAKYGSFHMESSTDASGKTTTYYYDSAGRQTAISESNGNRRKHISFEYDALSFLYKKKEWFDGDESCATVFITEHDNLGRVIEQRTENCKSELLRKIRYCYDERGNRTSVVSYSENDKPQKTEISYNFYNEPYKSVDALGNVVFTSYNHAYRNARGQRVLQKIITDPMGNATEIIMDARGREEILIKKNPLGKEIFKKETKYDASGNKNRETHFIIRKGALHTEYSIIKNYGPLNRLERCIEAPGTSLQKQTLYTYNAYGEQCRKTNPNGTHIFYEYDDFGRVSSYRASDNSFHYEYQYDANHHVSSIKDRIYHTISYREYDDFGYIAKDSLANGLAIEYENDLIGRCKRIRLPDGSSIQYNYESANMKNIIRNSSKGTPLYQYSYEEYDLLGNVKQARNIDEASVISYKRDALNRLTSISSDFFSFETTENGFDPSGNLCSARIVDGIGEVRYKFSHNDLSQIQYESGDATHLYEYDSVQNRIKKDGNIQRVNALNQTEYDGEHFYKYDANGNIIEKTREGKSILYRYDALGRLLELKEENNLHIHYFYDAFNRRLKKSISKWDKKDLSWKKIGELRFLYHNKKEIGAVDSSGSVVELRILGKGFGAEVGAAVAIELDGKTYIPQNDYRGNIICLLDLERKIIAESYRYTSFGEERIFDEKGNEIETSFLGNPWRFSSKRCDEETGLLYFGGRYYDPIMGKWITPDPLGFQDGPNLYAYVHNKPLTAIDLYGHFAISQTIKNAADIGIVFLKNFLEFTVSQTKKSISGVASILDQISLDLTGRGRFYNILYEDMQTHRGRIGSGELYSGLRITFVNGICTYRERCLEVAKFISVTHGNTNVHYVGATTKGMAIDIYNSIFMQMGMKPQVCMHLAEMWKHLIEEMEGDEKNGKIIHYAHSQGGIITNGAKDFMTPEERKMIEVRTIASPYLIRENSFGKATNYVSTRDLIPMIDILAYLQADPFGCLNGFSCPVKTNIVFLGSWYDGWPIVDHSMESESYQKIIIALGENLMEEYGKLH